MKVGQILSFVEVDGVVPASYRDLFQSTMARLQGRSAAFSRRDSGVIQPSSGRGPKRSSPTSHPKPVAAAPSVRCTWPGWPTVPSWPSKSSIRECRTRCEADLPIPTAASVSRADWLCSAHRPPRLDPKVHGGGDTRSGRGRTGLPDEAANQQGSTRSTTGIRSSTFRRFTRVLDRPGPRHEYVHGSPWSTATAAEEAIRSRLVRHLPFRVLEPAPPWLSTPTHIRGTTSSTRDGTVTSSTFGCVKRFTAERVSSCPR